MNGYKMFADRLGNIDVKNYVADAKRYTIAEYVITVCENTNGNINRKQADGYTDKWITKLLEKADGWTLGLLHKPGNSIEADKQVYYFIDRVRTHYTNSHLRAMYTMFNVNSTMSNGGAIKYVALLRAAFPRLALVYVGPAKPPCAGAEYIISQADEIMPIPKTSTWKEAYAAAWTNHIILAKEDAKIMPCLPLVTDALYGFTTPAKAKRDAYAAEFNKSAMSDDCMTMGIWRQDVISGAGKIMDGITWTRKAVEEPEPVEEPVTQDEPTDADKLAILWTEYKENHK